MTDTSISPLRQRMIEDMTVRGFTPSTQRGYIVAVRGFAAFFGRSPDEAETEDLRRYQFHMRSSGASATSMNAVVSAFAASSSMSCPTAFTASATTACSPTPCALRTCHDYGNCLVSWRNSARPTRPMSLLPMITRRKRLPIPAPAAADK